MINFIDKKTPPLPQSQSLVITYPRTVCIIFGNYSFPSDIHNMILEVKEKISEKDSYACNVKAGRTGWHEFVDHPFTKKFFNYCINKHTYSHPEVFERFYERFKIVEAWGNEVKKGDYVIEHTHTHYHGILYLTKGAPLFLRELNLKITPEPGDYYFFPPHICHHVEESLEEDKRYNLVFNFEHDEFPAA